MPYFYADPFDYYVYGGAVHAEGLWQVVRPVTSYGTTFGRFGGHGVNLANSTSGLARTVPGLSEVYIGFGATGKGTNLDSQSIRLATFTDGAGQSMIEVRLRGTGTIEGVRRSPSTTSGETIFASAPGAFRFGGYNQHIQIRALIHNAGGTLVVMVDGTAVIDLVGVANTRFTGIGGTDISVIGHGITAGGGAPSFDMQDYWTTDTGFLGDKRVRSRAVDAEGDELDWSPSTGTDRAVLASDGNDATFNETSTVGHRLGFEHEDSDIDTIAVSNVIVASRITNVSGGGTEFKHGIRQGSSTVLSSISHVTPGAPAWLWTEFDQDPTDSSGWTPAKVDSLQSVVEKTV